MVQKNTAEKQWLKSKIAGSGRPVLVTPRLGKIMRLCGVSFFVGIISLKKSLKKENTKMICSDSHNELGLVC